MSSPVIALTADVGESFGAYTMGNDELLLDELTNANIACGFHAGDPMIMDRTVRLCVEKNVEIGAHPGYRDLVGFGRRNIGISVEELRNDLLYQIGALSAFVRVHGGRIGHLVPHGALGVRCAMEEPFARVVIGIVEQLDPIPTVVALDGPLAKLAEIAGLPVARIFLADRGYEPDGSIRSRRLPGSVITDPDEVAERTIRVAEEGTVVCSDGTVRPVTGDVVLLHGDTPNAVDSARALRSALVGAGVELVPASQVSAHHSRRPS